MASNALSSDVLLFWSSYLLRPLLLEASPSVQRGCWMHRRPEGAFLHLEFVLLFLPLPAELELVLLGPAFNRNPR